MKKLLLIGLLFTGIVNAQIINIPDVNFKAKLLAADVSVQIAVGTSGNMKIDANNDGQIEVAEVLPIKGLYIANASIGSLTGIEYFTNLTFLRCSGNQIANLDLSALVNLANLECNNNQLTNLSLPQTTSLRDIHCENNQLAVLGMSGMTELRALNCSNNQLGSLDLTGMTFLYNLFCSNNQLTQIDIRGNLVTVDCSNNLIGSIDLSNVDLAQNIALLCSNNPLTQVEFGAVTRLSEFLCSNTLLTNLDISGQKLSYLECKNNPNLTTLLLKGSVGNYAEFGDLTYLDVGNNPNLNYVCANEEYFNYVNAELVSSGQQASYELNAYCSFVPEGFYNTISGTMIFDAANDGCDVSDLPYPNIRINNFDGTNQTAGYVDGSGNYTFYTQAGNFDLTPALENATFFDVTPLSSTVNFTDTNNNTATRNFCITPNGIHPDLEIIIAPKMRARPGFDAEYMITYKNKGNQLLSGDVTFNYDEAVLDFVSTSTAPNSQGSGTIFWSYTDLHPFEARTFEVVLNVNSSVETPSVNVNDILTFTASINPVTGDATTTDNTFQFRQVVKGSLDPNEKLCLEGNTIAASQIGKYIHYVINFENVGTDIAENIVVKDSINSTDFNIRSLQVLNGSNAVETKIKNNYVEFIFKNIHLPIGGHGNVLFKIKTQPDLSVGDEVANMANIYFDYNAPIDTEEARSLFSNLSNDDFLIREKISVVPNPARNLVKVSAEIDITSVQIFDSTGRLLQTVLESSKALTIDVSDKTKGVYFLKINTDRGSGLQKIIKE